jgi:hypothetical protein
MRDFTTASKVLHEAMEMHEKAKDERAVLDTFVRLAESYTGMNKPQDVGVYIHAASLLARKLVNKGVLTEIPQSVKDLERFIRRPDANN